MVGRNAPLESSSAVFIRATIYSTLLVAKFLLSKAGRGGERRFLRLDLSFAASLYLELEEKHRFPGGGQCMLINLLGQFNFQHGASSLLFYFILFFFLPLSFPLSRKSITANDLLTHFAGRHPSLSFANFCWKIDALLRDAPLSEGKGKRGKKLSRSSSYNFLKDRAGEYTASVRR